MNTALALACGLVWGADSPGRGVMDAPWGPLVPSQAAAPALSIGTTARWSPAVHVFPTISASYGRSPSWRRGWWLGVDGVALAWAVPGEDRAGLAGHLGGVSWGRFQAFRLKRATLGLSVELGGQNHLWGGGVVRSSAAERYWGPRVAHRIWWERGPVALNAGFLLMVDGYGYLGADLGVRVALSGELALLITNALESELWTSGVGVAKPLDGGWQGSVSTLVMSFPPWLWASAREDGWTAGDQAGPLMLHAEAAWRGPPRRKRE